MNDYYYLYKNALGKWNDARNPAFIAKHKYCRAVPIKEVEKLGFKIITDFIWELNGYGESKVNTNDIVKDWELY